MTSFLGSINLVITLIYECKQKNLLLREVWGFSFEGIYLVVLCELVGFYIVGTYECIVIKHNKC